MSVSLLVLELWQFSFIRDWPEIRNLEMPPSVHYSISGDWNRLGIPNLAKMFLMKGYWMQKNARVTSFAVSELSREHQKAGTFYPLTRLGLRKVRYVKQIKSTQVYEGVIFTQRSNFCFIFTPMLGTCICPCQWGRR